MVVYLSLEKVHVKVIVLVVPSRLQLVSPVIVQFTDTNLCLPGLAYSEIFL